MADSHFILRTIIGLCFVAMLGTAGFYFSSHNMLTVGQATTSTPEAAPQQTESQAEAQSVPMQSETQAHLMSMMSELQKNPNDVHALTGIARHFMGSGDFGMAERFAERVLHIEAKNPDALYIRGIARHNQNRHLEAVRDFEDAMSVQDSFALRYNLGILYGYFLNDKELGKKHLTKALEFPDVPQELKESVEKDIAKMQVSENKN